MYRELRPDSGRPGGTGYGRDPYCNIVDEAGRSLPVFGPLLLGASQRSLPFIRRLRVSDPSRWTGSIRSVSCPPARFKGRERVFKSDFCTIMCDLSCRAPARQLVHASFTLAAGEAMKLLLHLGYDGPVRVWLDGREAYCDPKGCS